MLQDHLIQKLSKIKLALFDVDGVMTDGRIFFVSDQWCRQFSVRDGAGIVLLKKIGIKTGIITGANSVDVEKRAQHLKMDFFYKNKTDKGPAFEEIKKLSGFNDEEISYIGDDVFDVPILEQVGFSASVPGAVDEAKNVVDYVTQAKAGHGAVRELCNLLMKYGNKKS